MIERMCLQAQKVLLECEPKRVGLESFGEMRAHLLMSDCIIFRELGYRNHRRSDLKTCSF